MKCIITRVESKFGKNGSNNLLSKTLDCRRVLVDQTRRLPSPSLSLSTVGISGKVRDPDQVSAHASTEYTTNNRILLSLLPSEARNVENSKCKFIRSLKRHRNVSFAGSRQHNVTTTNSDGNVTLSQSICKNNQEKRQKGGDEIPHNIILSFSSLLSSGKAIRLLNSASRPNTAHSICMPTTLHNSSDVNVFRWNYCTSMQPYYNNYRYMSTTNNSPNNKSDETGNDVNKDKIDTTLTEQTVRELSTLSNQAAIKARELEERFKHFLYDQLPGIVVVTIAALLLATPYAVEQMQKNDHSASAVDLSDDPIDDFMKLAKQEWNSYDEKYNMYDNDSSDDFETNRTKNLLQAILMDVFNSKNVQDTAKHFVIQILTSDVFKAAMGRLVRELWNDLITDPETTAQVVRVLERAIQDPVIKKSAQQLVLQLVDDPAVKEALIQLLQRLGNDNAVRQAAIDLLTSSAHTTLSDPDVLDHSMEFATDVVGDDIVQRTAGEALRNTVGHAFVKPASMVVLTSIGVSLIIFGAISVGYSRSTEQEAVLMERAARSLQYNASYGISRIITWPARNMKSFYNYITHTLLIPTFYGINQSISDTTTSIHYAVTATLSHIFIEIPSNTIIAIQSYFSHIFVEIPFKVLNDICNSLCDGITYVVSVPRDIRNAFVQMIVDFATCIQQTMCEWLSRGGEFIGELLITVATGLGNTVTSMSCATKTVTEIYLSKMWDYWIAIDWISVSQVSFRWLEDIYLSILNVASDDAYYESAQKTVQSLTRHADESIVRVYWIAYSFVMDQWETESALYLYGLSDTTRSKQNPQST